MRKNLIATALLGAIWGAPLYAEPLNSETLYSQTRATAPAPLLAQLDQSGFQGWLAPLMSKVNQLPEIQAQQAKIRQAQLLVEAADRPVYNPELGVSYQNASEDTYTLEVSQTLDWGDKRGVATRVAQLEAEILLADNRLARSRLYGELLMALVEQAQQAKLLAFQGRLLGSAKQQVAIAKQQFEAGALSRAEMQLMQLDLASKAADHANAEQASLAADAAVLSRFGELDLPFAEFIGALSVDTSQEVGPALPALAGAYQQVMMAKLASQQVAADTSADPSISLSAEREGEENKLGLGLSIPIQIRNDYREAKAAAGTQVAIAEQDYLARERSLTQAAKLFHLSLPRLQQRYREWRELVLTSGAGVQDALSQQWRAGDISTGDYLQGQRQLANSYLAGLSLESALYRSWLDWMGQSGQLENYLQRQLGREGV
ncbi:TolC family protein [Shewanella insulae]|uniref:TolC family protein n=1 Tax=Shewanella insulae TaxID=2681496 RepID=UPI001EFDA022|nr:TolC family protein [Shewanella insulae]MCG9712408.1 TolC family protein [Shewanella insulae]